MLNMITKRGFTLIELSIVLVIIGLLAAGVLIGRDLIRAAEIRTQVSQFYEIQTAVNAFKLKYNCFPGDCLVATQLFSPVDPNCANEIDEGICNGNGNGRIENSNGQTYDQDPMADWRLSHEVTGFFKQLRLANMISDSSVETGTIVQGLPTLRMNRKGGFFPNNTDAFITLADGRNPPLYDWPNGVAFDYRRGSNWLWAVACNFSNGAPTDMKFWDDRCGIFTGAELASLDIKMDDGRPLTGNLMGFGGAWDVNTDCLEGTTHNEMRAGNKYDVLKTNPECLAIVNLD
jgi:prepilin-type N-terminal cleavage/methylation domain-containing protein